MSETYYTKGEEMTEPLASDRELRQILTENMIHTVGTKESEARKSDLRHMLWLKGFYNPYPYKPTDRFTQMCGVCGEHTVSTIDGIKCTSPSCGCMSFPEVVNAIKIDGVIINFEPYVTASPMF